MKPSSEVRAKLNMSQFGGLCIEEDILIRAVTHLENGGAVRASSTPPYVQVTKPTMGTSRTKIHGDVPLETTRGCVAPYSQSVQWGATVRFLSFLSTMRDAFETVGTSGVAVVGFIANVWVRTLGMYTRNSSQWWLLTTMRSLPISLNMGAGCTSSICCLGGYSSMTGYVNLTMRSRAQLGHTGRMRRSSLTSFLELLACVYRFSQQTNSSSSTYRG